MLTDPKELHAASPMPTAAEISWTQAPAPWPDVRPVLALAAEILPLITDDVIADLVEQLVDAIKDKDIEPAAARLVSSAAFTRLHTQHVEIGRLQKRFRVLLTGHMDDSDRL